LAQAQAGRLTGSVTDAGTLAPLNSVQVFIEGTSINALTNSAGAYTLPTVPPGTYTLVARRIGFQEAKHLSVVVNAGATTTLNVSMNAVVLALQGIVGTGMIDPVEGVRAPIAVARVTREMMPVMAAGSPIQSLQGRVPGVTINRSSGQPGSGVSMMLRTPTTLRSDAGAPLIVVDGVILGGSGVISTTDIEALDIESMEIIRGAAASSLYGSRASAGVISITTARGTSLPLGKTQFTARTEM
jgi:TonB-dependent SusC/RagA subfamily outer membrane receptor